MVSGTQMKDCHCAAKLKRRFAVARVQPCLKVGHGRMLKTSVGELIHVVGEVQELNFHSDASAPSQVPMEHGRLDYAPSQVPMEHERLDDCEG